MTFTATYIALWVLVAMQCLLILALVKQFAELKRLLDKGGLPGPQRLPAGTPAPEFEGADLRSGRLISSADWNGRGGLILFLSPECTLCRRLASGLEHLEQDALSRLVVLCQGDERGCQEFSRQIGAAVAVLFDRSPGAAARYRVSGSPTAVLLDEALRVRGYGHPNGVEDLKQLLTSLREGQPVPQLVPPATALSVGGSR
jgi:hypothetical protein